MASQAQQQLDDILDARASKRDARKAYETARVAMNQAKSAWNESKERLETLMDEVEQRQGRLPFEDAVETEQIAAAPPDPYTQGVPARRRGRPKRDAEGPRA